jgi:hypothetical protein
VLQCGRPPSSPFFLILQGVTDVCDRWISSIGRTKADAIAGVALPPTGDKSVTTVPEAIPKSAGAVIMPIFNAVDDSDTTQESSARVVGNVFGVKSGFYGNIRSMIQGLRMKEVIEVCRLFGKRHNTC